MEDIGPQIDLDGQRAISSDMKQGHTFTLQDAIRAYRRVKGKQV